MCRSRSEKYRSENAHHAALGTLNTLRGPGSRNRQRSTATRGSLQVPRLIGSHRPSRHHIPPRRCVSRHSGARGTLRKLNQLNQCRIRNAKTFHSRKKCEFVRLNLLGAHNVTHTEAADVQSVRHQLPVATREEEKRGHSTLWRKSRMSHLLAAGRSTSAFVE